MVEHRARQYITAGTSAENTVPLYRPHNVTPLTATWIGNHKKDVSFELNEDHDKHTIKNGTYVLLKRFSSKDEKRRLVASVHLTNMHYCESIGFGNKLNYIGVLGTELSTIEAYGLAAIFNSSFMDKYFRCISGNTQVNATEIRVMKFPSRDQVREIGEQAQQLKFFEAAKIVGSIWGQKIYDAFIQGELGSSRLKSWLRHPLDKKSEFSAFYLNRPCRCSVDDL